MYADKWIEIDVAAVENNLAQVQTLLEHKTRLIAVIKANAYGHGAVETARILVRNGVDFLAVSFYAEAMQLRQAGIQTEILVFSPLISPEEARESVRHQLTLTIAGDDDCELLAQASAALSCQLKVHLKIDTGLGRFGLTEDMAVQVGQKIDRHQQLCLAGIYTHAADPSSPAYTAGQFKQFKQVIGRLEQEGIVIPLQHMANSAVLLRSPEMYLSAVRIGTLLAGQHPVGNFPIRLQLQDPYKFKGRITSLRTLEKGSYLGYYRSFKLRRTAQIAVLPVGFNDGLALEVGNPPASWRDMLRKLAKICLGYFNWPRFNLKVRIQDRSCLIRGKVFMQMALVEIPPGLKVKVGDEVELPVRKTVASASITRIYIEAEHHYEG
ncbi:MAG: alanine racemase [Firmicutes bacterium]|nr:alanine racemase [Bacillota bacterium]